MHLQHAVDVIMCLITVRKRSLVLHVKLRFLNIPWMWLYCITPMNASPCLPLEYLLMHTSLIFVNLWSTVWACKCLWIIPLHCIKAFIVPFFFFLLEPVAVSSPETNMCFVTRWDGILVEQLQKDPLACLCPWQTSLCLIIGNRLFHVGTQKAYISLVYIWSSGSPANPPKSKLLNMSYIWTHSKSWSLGLRTPDFHQFSGFTKTE